MHRLVVHHCVLILSAILVYVEIAAQEHYFHIDHLETADGVTIRPTGNPVEDEFGFIWIPTNTGLMRFDGYEFETFRPHVPDSATVPQEELRQLYPARDGRIFITSFFRGLSLFDPQTGQFKCWAPLTKDTVSFLLRNVQGMLESENGGWWVAYTGLHFWYPDSNFIQSYIPSELLGKDETEAEDYDLFSTICRDPGNSNVLWMATAKVLLRFDISAAQFTSYPVQTDSEEGLVHKPQSLFAGNDGKIYVGTWYDGLHIFDTATHQWEVRYVLGAKDSFGLNNNIQEIQQKSSSELWVLAPWRGLFVYSMSNNAFRLVVPHRSISGFPAGSPYQFKGEPLGLMETKDGTMFLRRYPVGIEVIHPQQQQFRKIITRTTVNKVLPHPNNGILYLLTDNGVLQLYDQRTGKIEEYPVVTWRDRRDLHSGAFQSDGSVLLLGREAFYKPDGKQVFPFPVRAFDSLQLAPDMHDKGHGRCFLVDDRDHLWIPLKWDGILKINLATGRSEVVPISSTAFGKPYSWSFANDILQSESGDIWIAFQQGVCYTRDYGASWNKYSFTTPNDKGLEFRNISSLETDKAGRIWMGSKMHGLFFTEAGRKADSLQVLTEDDGLASNKVLDLELDETGHLWVVTDKGLSKMNTTTLAFENFGSEYGLHGLRRLTVLPDGQMTVSATHGFYLFDPDSVVHRALRLSPVVHDFRVFGEQIETPRAIAYLKSVNLRHDQNFFSFEFCAPNYLIPRKIKYQYQLEGVDEHWVNAEGRLFANYTAIAPGSYTFKVRASDPAGKWSTASTAMTLHITPPWWRSGLAYVVYALLLLSALAVIYWYQRRRWALRARLQVEQEKAKRLKDLDTFKTRFYTNITHEFRTPLTVISGLTDHITGNSDIRRTIRRNSKRLMTMVNQLLDLSKLETNNLAIDWQQGDIIPYLEYLTESCHSLAQDKHLNLSFFSRQQEIVMDYDEKIIEQILVNLLSNAIKFTPQYGSVKVIAGKIERQGNPTLELVVRDTGSGIPEEKLPFIFDRFYQADDSAMRPGEGTGIGLALVRELLRLIEGHIEVMSIVDRGTTFTVYLPIHHDAAMTPAYQVQDGIQPVREEFVREPSTVPELSGDKPVVLIIEDNVDVIDYMIRCLQGHYALLTARNGKKGVETALEYIPDAIISDVMMPEMDGFKVCETVKEDRRTSHIPIILLTAKATQEDKVTGLTHGADAYLTKPFDQQELLVRLENLTALSARLRQSLKAPTSVEDRAVKRESAFLDEVAEVIESRLDNESFGTRELCRAIAMSRTQLHRKLKALTGHSTAAYIRMVRLKKARALLQTTDLPIGDIAMQVGFKDFSHFSRSFSKEYGTTPSEVRG